MTEKASASTKRARAIGITLGVLLLAGVVGLAVLLPKVSGTGGSVSMPETLPGGFTSIRTAELPEQAQGVDPDEFAAEQEEWVAYTEETATEVFGDPVSFDTYVSEDWQTAIYATVYSGDGGAVGPTMGLRSPESAEQQGMAAPPEELVSRGEAICKITWSQAPPGQQQGEQAAPQEVLCQQEHGGRTVQILTGGVSVDQATEYLENVADSI